MEIQNRDDWPAITKRGTYDDERKICRVLTKEPRQVSFLKPSGRRMKYNHPPFMIFKQR
jgi:hypothetical protein